MTAAATTRPATPVLQWRPYQRECIDDRHRVQLDIWSRQTGKDFTTAFKVVLRGLAGGADWLCGSLTQRQADLTFDKVATHARAIGKALCPERHEEFEATLGGRPFRFTRRELTLPSGVRIISLPGRDPNSWAGYTAHVVLSEFALFPGGGHKHWQVITPIALTNGLNVWVITTPRGKDTKAYELRKNERGRYSVRIVDVYRAVADGLVLRNENGDPCSVEEFREIYGDPVGWQTEYLCLECDDMDALVGWADIERAYEKYDAAVLDCADNGEYDPTKGNVFKLRLRPLKGRLTAGWDVARKRHLSVLWINEELAGRQWLRMLVVFRRCSFAYQNAVIEQAMNALPGLCGCGDSTGLGMESNERLQAKYGELRWRGVNFAGGRKLGLASRLQTTYQGNGQALPASLEWVAYDLHGLQKQVVGDRTVIHETANPLEADSHCDAAMANALALEAASVEAMETRTWVA